MGFMGRRGRPKETVLSNSFESIFLKMLGYCVTRWFSTFFLQFQNA